MKRHVQLTKMLLFKYFKKSAKMYFLTLVMCTLGREQLHWPTERYHQVMEYISAESAASKTKIK